MMTKTIFNLNDKLSIGNYLVQNKIIQSIAQIRKIEKAGDGNMNFAVRIKTTGGSFILKQSRPYVEKYPQIPAPEHRVSMESRFYRLVSRSPGIVNHMPRIVHSDSDQDVLILQDLGELSSFEQIYSGYKMTRKEVDQLIDWL
ncbi:MAG: aminoglycoside phosphotransferase, partial [Bacteroidota bacterium]